MYILNNTDTLTLEAMARKTKSKKKLLELCEVGDFNLQEILTWRKNLPAECYRILYNRLDATGRGSFALAFNRDCPTDLLEKFISSRFYMARRGVALNPNTPEKLLKQLLKDPETSVRFGVAENPCITFTLQKRILKEENEILHYILTKNPNLSPEIELELTQSSFFSVRRNLAKQEKLKSWNQK